MDATNYSGLCECLNIRHYVWPIETGVQRDVWQCVDCRAEFCRRAPMAARIEDAQIEIAKLNSKLAVVTEAFKNAIELVSCHNQNKNLLGQSCQAVRTAEWCDNCECVDALKKEIE